MTQDEKALYHQIHPLKLATDIGAEVVSLYFFWQRKLGLGLIAALVPPIIASALIINVVDLEPYKQSTFGRYVRTYMTAPAVALRIVGTVVTHIGAWTRKPALIPVGLGLVLFGWTRGILWPNKE